MCHSSPPECQLNILFMFEFFSVLCLLFVLSFRATAVAGSVCPSCPSRSRSDEKIHSLLSKVTQSYHIQWVHILYFYNTLIFFLHRRRKNEIRNWGNSPWRIVLAGRYHSQPSQNRRIKAQIQAVWPWWRQKMGTFLSWRMGNIERLPLCVQTNLSVIVQ